jgi:hypothetical protein
MKKRRGFRRSKDVDNCYALYYTHFIYTSLKKEKAKAYVSTHVLARASSVSTEQNGKCLFL